jgi:hypothetical protein
MDPRVSELQSLLKQNAGRFGNYQVLAPVAFSRIAGLSEFDYRQTQVALDEPRYRWLTENLDPSGFRVSEIGASLGYFSLMLAAEYEAHAAAYEAIDAYSRVTAIIADLCGVGDRVEAVPASVSLHDLRSMPEVDLAISLNVLHHAGSSFDVALVSGASSWRSYAQRYLSLLAAKATYLFFQVGNVLNGRSLFDDETTLQFLQRLLQDSGWQVTNVGVIEDFLRLNYDTYDPGALSKASVITCHRNLQTGLVDYFKGEERVATLETGLAHRPLWLCQRRDRP